jgi:acid phosphatase (class A)
MKLSTALLALAMSAIAAYGQAPKKTFKYLTPDQTDPGRLLPPPPEDGSPTQVTDMAAMWKLVKSRTPERFKQAQWDNDHEDISAFAATIGPDFDLKKLPATVKLFSEVQNDENLLAVTAKAYFHRKFATELDAGLIDLNCDPADVRESMAKPGGRKAASWPSGHATMGYSFAIILASLIPEKAQAIMVRARDYGYSREVCGDHYHDDVEASHALGTAAGIMLLQNAALQPLIEASRAELRAAHITNH